MFRAILEKCKHIKQNEEIVFHLNLTEKASVYNNESIVFFQFFFHSVYVNILHDPV